MRKTMLLALAVSALLFGSCQKVDEDEIKRGEGEAPSEAEARKNVQFVVAGITEEYSTRATIQSVGCTDLWVYEGTTLLKHQTSTDTDFGLPTISLTYGSHDLTFVASSADGQQFSTQWQCTKVKDTFAKQMNVTVSGGSSTSRQVELKRRNSKVVFTIQDAIPSTVKTMHLTVQNHLALDASLLGQEASVYDVSVDISSRVGQTGFAPAVNMLTTSATEEEDCEVMIEFLSAEGTVLYHYERTIKVKPNRVTNLTGKYFQGDAQTVSINETWEDEYKVNL